MIRNVLFDLDDTLFDFHKAEKIALTKTLVHFGIDPTEETLALYSTINAAHWKRLELGEISREEVKVGRYRELFETIGVECDPVRRLRIMKVCSQSATILCPVHPSC